MPSTIVRGFLLIGLLPVLGACDAECGADDPPQPLKPGTYSVALQDGSGAGGGGAIDQVPGSSFPHDGRSVSVQVDREAGLVYARWTNDEGQLVVETWRMEEVNAEP